MKKILLLAALVLASTSILLAGGEGHRKERKEDRIEKRKDRQELRRARREQERTEVSIAARDQFNEDFPSARQAVFSNADGYTVAAFIQDGRLQKAYYDQDNELVGTTRKVSFTSLPESAQKRIVKEYPAYTITGIIKYEDNEDNADNMILYNSAIPDDGYFVEIQLGDHTRVLQVTTAGDVYFFKAL